MRAFQSPRRPATHHFTAITGYNLAGSRRLGEVISDVPPAPEQLKSGDVEYIRRDKCEAATRTMMLIAGGTGLLAGAAAVWIFSGK